MFFIKEHLVNVITGALEFLYVLLPVFSLVALAYRFTIETGKRTGSSLLFFSAIFYLIGVYESFYITMRFGVITSGELILLQIIYIIGGFLLLMGVIALYNFFVALTGFKNSISLARRRILFFGAIFAVFLVLYFLTHLNQDVLFSFTDIFYAIIQFQFFSAYTILGEIMMTNKEICAKAPRRSRQIQIVSLYFLIEPILWLYILNLDLPGTILTYILFVLEVIGVIVAGFLTFNILHILFSHSPLLLEEYKSRYLAVAKSDIMKRLSIIAGLAGISIVLSGTLATGLFFDLQEQIFRNKVFKDSEIIKVFARETEREIESLSLKVQLVMKNNFKSEKIKDTIRSIKERYAEVVSNIFLYDKNGKIYYSYPETLDFRIPEKFLKEKLVTTPILRGGDGFHSIALYPYFDENGKFQGGIGVDFNFENLHGNLKKIVEKSSRILFVEPDSKIIIAGKQKAIGLDLVEFLSSQVDSPLGIKSDDLLIGDTLIYKRVYANSRRTILAIASIPINLNSNRFYVLDYHFLEDFGILEFIPRTALFWMILSSLGILISLVVILFLSFKFSEHLEYEIEKRTIELVKSEEKYRSIVENPFFGAYLMDISGFKFVNDKFCEIFGYTKDEILNLKDYFVLIHPDDRERLKRQLRDRLRGDLEINKWSAKGLRKSGEVIFIEGYTKRVEYEGKPAAQGMILDVTEEVKRREALQQIQKLEALGTLASGIAHDFNNILQIIIGAGQLLKMKLKDTEYMRWIDTINTTALRGAELAKRLLTFSRKKPSEELKSVNLHHLIEDAVKVFRETFPRNIEIETHLEAENHIILGEEAQVQQVILNLAVNAKDAMPNGGKLIFRTESRLGNGFEANPDIEYVVMHVIDTGVGMSEEVKRRIFEPFFTTKPVGKGTGLGLSTVYGIVKSYGGFIKVYSELGKGTKFSVYIPVHKEFQSEKKNEEVRKMIKTGTLLLIDDEEEIRFSGKELLESEGFKVYVASNGIEGIEIYKKHKDEIDLVILDLNMPKMSGKETLAQLLLINPNVKVIIATGYITESEREEVKGVAGFIEKPFDLSKLLKMIAEILE
ncbi:MAG: response regulator [Candidatus Kryptonium sp.]|nr:response regulator [Candidatus Kryptonium sp.]